MGKTHIEWAATAQEDGSTIPGFTWNPLCGCSLKSAGCTHCYAMVMAARIANAAQAALRAGKTLTATQTAYRRVVKWERGGMDAADNDKALPLWNGRVELLPDELSTPIRRKAPTTWLVNSMSDLFHADVPFEFVDKVFAVMAFCSQHTFQVLTKRADRQAEYIASRKRSAQHWKDAARTLGIALDYEGTSLVPYPLRNVWLGFSAENQKCFDERAVQAAQMMRDGWTVFVSAEPLLGPIKMQGWDEDAKVKRNWLNGADGPGISWIIVGGESGRDPRNCDVEWIRRIVQQCRDTKTPVFVKQLGSRPTTRLPAGEQWPGHTGPSSPVQFSGDGIGNYLVRGLQSAKGGDPAEWPADLRIREFPRTARAS